LPSLLGALTLYIISRSFNFYLVEKRNWKPWLAAIAIILIALFVIIIPSYLIVDLLVQKIGNAQQYAAQFNDFVDKVMHYVQNKIDIDILSKENKQKISEFAGKVSTTILNTTLNTLTVISAMFFILYFMLTNARLFERILMGISPLKRSNGKKIGDKFRKLVIANAVGIPVVALGQAIVAVIGYLIFGAPSPLLLFALTFIGSMIPIVGAAIVCPNVLFRQTLEYIFYATFHGFHRQYFIAAFYRKIENFSPDIGVGNNRKSSFRKCIYSTDILQLLQSGGSFLKFYFQMHTVFIKMADF
jgi:predicted PurR-regulated permease PerM